MAEHNANLQLLPNMGVIVLLKFLITLFQLYKNVIFFYLTKIQLNHKRTSHAPYQISIICMIKKKKDLHLKKPLLNL
jgi:hypothetical protein